MRRPRFSIAALMAVVVVASVVIAVYRAGSFWGLAILVPFAVSSSFALFEPGPVWSRRSLWAAAIGTLIVPFLIAIMLNKHEWGYFLSRPPVDRRIVEAHKAHSVTHVEADRDADGQIRFTGESIGEVAKWSQRSPHDGDYYVLEGRVLRELRTRDLIPESPEPMPPERWADLYRLLDETGRLEDGVDSDYADAKLVHGVVIEAVGRDNRPLLFFGVRGQQVSNDHYPFYEFLFEQESVGTLPRLVAFQRFYYDVAGMEGAEWPAFLGIFAYLGLILTIFVQPFLYWQGRRRRTKLIRGVNRS